MAPTVDLIDGEWFAELVLEQRLSSTLSLWWTAAGSTDSRRSETVHGGPPRTARSAARRRAGRRSRLLT